MPEPRGPETIRVLALIECYSITGPAKNLLEFAQWARRPDSEGFAVEVSIAAFRRGKPAPPTAFVSAAEQAGIPVDVIAERRRFDPNVPAQLRAVVARRRPHIIQSHNSKSHLLVRMLGLRRACPWVAFHHGYTDIGFLDRAYNRIGGWALRAAPRVVTVCNAFSLDLQRRGVPARRIAVRHNMVKPFVPPPAVEVGELKAALGLPPATRIILSVGRLSREKGHAGLVRALEILRRRNPDLPLRLVLAGAGPERDVIESLASSLGIAANIVLAGHRTNLAPFYAMADVAVLPSRSEGSPNALLEAMAAGLPVVATSVGGVPEIASHRQDALLVPCGDAEAMAGAIAELLADAALAARLGSAAQRVAARYTPESYCCSMVRLYKELLSPARFIGRPVSASL
jgi:glycosyltransferase involved in cell wall biosynthesis